MQRQLDDDLDEREIEVLDNHTRQCPDCAAMLERLKLLSAELTSLPKVTPSYSLVDAIMPQLERIELFGQTEAATAPAANQELEEPAPRRAKRERRWPSVRVMGGVIAAGIVAGLFLVTYNAGEGPNFSLTKHSADDSAANTAAEGDVRQYAFSNEDGEASDVRTEALHSIAGENDKSVKDTSKEDAVRSSGEPGAGDGSDGQPGKPIEGSSGGAPAGGSNAGTSGTGGDAGGGDEEAAADGAENGGGSEPTSPSEGEVGAQGDKQGNQGFGEDRAASVSPDGKYSAQAEGFVVKVYAASDQSLVLESTRKNGTLTNLVWSEDSARLTYEVHVEKGAIETYVIDMATREEKKAEHE
ncbi:zf-HC2 domain-containing protein [Paenibacillus sp. IB182493]|uniref:Zf-HC2 domain-containing protein n=2 Tax=Paenibacillus arenilitoris TaxID=2772299 RepID=A0A927CL52_9BACL|nr:zf-HC2 domain-containing protein [Paenibacillus arenilitoris]